MTGGRRAAPRAAEGRRPRRALLPQLGLAAALTALLVAWGYLVVVAVDFGGRARNGSGAAWFLLALATVGAVACLFLALLVGVRLVRLVLNPPTDRPSGGRRAAR
ncbi:hypothetical protein GCM10022215_21070 [Nocardioides fonticola]|uniref:Integral membrane protein n=1 Tax=Nocardioides fonticola TaxID=450363 RepID=A0ABP7XK17_9ACTN